MNEDVPLVFLVAGEPSGDVLGGRLMLALKQETFGAIRFAGIGGERMKAQGLKSLFPMEELALFGLAELLPKLPSLLRRMKQTEQAILDMKPAAVVTIDAPDFCFRVARRVKKANPDIPLIHYVAPTVWAWRPGRAAKIAKFLDHLLALLPFEPPYFEKAGLDCSFVGHPIVESGADAGDADRFRAKHDLESDTRIVTILPGSRRSEVTKLLPDFKGALDILAPRLPRVVAAVPTVPATRALVEEAVKSWPLPAVVVEGDQDKYDAFAASEAALAASGTVALELALARLPAVIAYRIHPLTYRLYRGLIKVRFVNLVNIMLNRMLVPELLQEECRPSRLAETLGRLLDDPAARQEQIEGVAEVAAWLGQGDTPPSRRAAEVVMRVIHTRAREAEQTGL
ncbi:lipid-A-disaccharide synthase [Nitrospirillum amazonense]|uniref:Lipid-A-disaccharide synthase n=1 Tax=Nitrospirillum amazonense TaxID=28077 RepID=A0A560K977_9PROT|nr:lipid-A-disaccharide synthase [Nitrospirillum amazonense]TWB79817.1 lipid-A-disaccharide synthase [Nitrospirillum amazonense]